MRIDVSTARIWHTRIRGGVLPSNDARPNPCIAGNTLYGVTFAPAMVFAIDRSSGQLRWTRALGRLGGPSVLVAGGVVFATTPRALFCLDRRDGSVRWWFEPYSEPGEWIYSSPHVVGRRVLVADRKGVVHSLDVRTGVVRATVDVGRGSQVNTTPLESHGALVFGTNGGDAVALSAADLRELWRTRLDGACVSAPFAIGRRVVIKTETLHWLDRATGKRTNLWKARGLVWSACPVGRRIFATVKNGDASQLHIVRDGKSIRSRTYEGFAMSAGLRDAPDEGHVYDARIGELGVLDRQTGKPLAAYAGFESPIGNPASTRTRIFVLDDSGVWCLAKPGRTSMPFGSREMSQRGGEAGRTH